MSNIKISILGCGWLGLPLGQFLVEKGFGVKGSTTHAEKLEKLTLAGIHAFQISFNPDVSGDNLADFFDSEILIISFPPRLKLNAPEFYLEQIASLLANLNKVKKVIFISSTSVYPDLNREVFENDVQKSEEAASPVLMKAELLLQDFCIQNQKDCLILRCAGLMGYERIPAKYFSGWKGLSTGNIPVNYIHRDDVIGIIEGFIQQNIWNETFNVVCPIHPIRKEIYQKNCAELGFELPEFVEPSKPTNFKIISPQKLQKQLIYRFIYENPLDFYYTSPKSV